jgi:hypothetical protein
MAIVFLVSTFLRLFLQVMVDERWFKATSAIGTCPKKYVHFLKSASKVAQNWNFESTWWPRFESQKLKMWMELEQSRMEKSI